MEKVNKLIEDMIERNYDALEDLDPSSEQAIELAKVTADLYKLLSDNNLGQQKIELEKVEKNDEKKAEKKNTWIKVGEIALKAGLTVATTMFNAAIFQNLLAFEKESTIGSTSMKTFLKGGFNIFKTNQM